MLRPVLVCFDLTYICSQSFVELKLSHFSLLVHYYPSSNLTPDSLRPSSTWRAEDLNPSPSDPSITSSFHAALKRRWSSHLCSAAPRRQSPDDSSLTCNVANSCIGTTDVWILVAASSKAMWSVSYSNAVAGTLKR